MVIERSIDVPVRDAATVILVRDVPEGLEVFMLLRNPDSAFGGAYVFPGGTLGDADRHNELEAVCQGRSDADASRRLGLESGGLAYWVAAIRECFEEAGVLLAYDIDGDIMRLSRPEVAARFVEHRRAVDRAERRLVEVCAAEDLRLAVDSMEYFSHWITPLGMPRRYDTRFFVAAAPPEQVPLHDNREAVDHAWIRAEEALERSARGEFTLMIPTIKNLEVIAEFKTSDDLLAATAERAAIPTIEPRVDVGDNGLRVILPGEEGYEDAHTPQRLVDIPVTGAR